MSVHIIQFSTGAYFIREDIFDYDWTAPYSTPNIKLAKIFNKRDRAEKICNKYLPGSIVLSFTEQEFFKMCLKS